MGMCTCNSRCYYCTCHHSYRVRNHSYHPPYTHLRLESITRKFTNVDGPYYFSLNVFMASKETNFYILTIHAIGESLNSFELRSSFGFPCLLNFSISILYMGFIFLIPAYYIKCPFLTHHAHHDFPQQAHDVRMMSD